MQPARRWAPVSRRFLRGCSSRGIRSLPIRPRSQSVPAAATASCPLSANLVHAATWVSFAPSCCRSGWPGASWLAGRLAGPPRCSPAPPSCPMPSCTGPFPIPTPHIHIPIHAGFYPSFQFSLLSHPAPASTGQLPSAGLCVHVLDVSWPCVAATKVWASSRLRRPRPPLKLLPVPASSRAIPTHPHHILHTHTHTYLLWICD